MPFLPSSPPSPGAVLLATAASLVVLAPGPSAVVPALATGTAVGETPVDGTRTGGPREGAPTPGARWRWPVDPRPRLARRFVAPDSQWGAGHRGVDLLAPAGTVVRAVESGRVLHAGSLAGRGTVTVVHADGLRSTYEPVDPAVRVGRTVAAGAVLGRLESSGGHCGGSACLHLGARQGQGYRDPWPLLVGGRVRLLPAAGAARDGP